MKYRILFILSIVLCILTCCGREEELLQDNLFNEDIKERPNGDWRMEEWKYDTLSTGTAYILYLTKYVQGLRYVDETFYPDGPEKSDVYFVGDRVYEMDTFATYLGAAEASQPVYYLSCYDGETGEIWHRQIRTPKLKEHPGKQQLLQRGCLYRWDLYSLYHDGFGWMHIYQNPEGGMWLEEYIEFMDSCVPVRRGTAEIENIIYEEAGGFFAGDRDAQSAAELIQNRASSNIFTINEISVFFPDGVMVVVPSLLKNRSSIAVSPSVTITHLCSVPTVVRSLAVKLVQYLQPISLIKSTIFSLSINTPFFAIFLFSVSIAF